MKKICTKCKEEKSLSDFHKHKSNKTGIRTICKICSTNYSSNWYKNNTEKSLQTKKKWREVSKQTDPLKLKLRDKESKLKCNFGITLDDYNRMFVTQNGNCGICKINQEKLKTPLGVDHCHKTGKVRELLCSNCNTALGLLKEDINVLEATIEYIKRNKFK